MKAVQRPRSCGPEDRGCATPSTATPPSGSSSRTSSSRRHGHAGSSSKTRQSTVESVGSSDGSPVHHRSGQRCIRWCDDFSALYQLGEQVMPSIHRAMEVRYAVTKGAGLWQAAAGCEVVVKVRNKSGAFSSKRAEQVWRNNSEKLLNLPACSSIVCLYEVLEDDARYYVVMEKVGGKDLHEQLHSEGRLSTEEVREVLRQLLMGVAELHAHGCIHKDIKMENVMFERYCGPRRGHQDGTSSTRVRTPPGMPLRSQVTEPALSTDSSSWALGTRPPSTRPTTPSSPVRCSSDPAASSLRSSLSGAARSIELPGAFPPAPTSMSPLHTPPEPPQPLATVRLIDFDTLQEWSPQTPKATDVLGTDQYIAPEAYEGRYSPASDVFAVGVIAYKLLAGSFPFRKSIFDDKPGENWVGSPKMRAICSRLREEKLDWRHAAFLGDGGARSLVSRMLALDDRLRPTAREALADPWLSAPRACQSTLSPLWVPLSQMP